MPVRIDGAVQVVEVKAMLFLNCSLRQGMALPESCAKLVGETHLSSMVFGLDIAKLTDRPMCPPKANPSFLSMWHFRLQSITDPVARADALKKFSDWCGKCRKLAEDTLPFKAWGLPGGPPKPREPANSQWLFGEEEDRPTTQDDPWDTRRILGRDIKVVVDNAANPETRFATTDLAQLENQAEEEKPWKIHKRGTKASLCSGGGRALGGYLANRKTGRLDLPSFGVSVTALSEPWGLLKNRQCFVNCGGKQYVGKVVVFRQPCHCPWDIEVMDAIPWPPGYPIPRNTAFISREGKCISRLSGGDFDGDIVFLIWDAVLLDLMAVSQPYVDAIDIDAHETEVKLFLAQSSTNWKAGCGSPDKRCKEFVKFCSSVPTLQLRGRVCAIFERAVWLFLEADPADRASDFKLAVDWGILAGLVMDCPKKYAVEAFQKAVSWFREGTDIVLRGPRETLRSTVALKPYLQMQIPNFKRSRTYEMYEDILVPAIGGEKGVLGKVWIPGVIVYSESPCVVLGKDAGRRVGELLLSFPRDVKHSDRSTTRSPIIEITHFLAQRMRRTTGLEDPVGAMQARKFDEMMAAWTTSRRSEIGRPSTLSVSWYL